MQEIKQITATDLTTVAITKIATSQATVIVTDLIIVPEIITVIDSYYSKGRYTTLLYDYEDDILHSLFLIVHLLNEYIFG